MAQNPDLEAALPQTNAQPVVPPMATMTPPMPNTAINDFIYFVCSIPNASMFRQDGKKLPFIGGYLKTNIKEDIAYLDHEIADGSIYIRRAKNSEIDSARMFEDPLGVIRETVRKEVEAKVKNDFTVEQLEQLLKEKKKVKPVEVAEDPSTKARRLLAEMQSKQLKPASTKDIALGIDASISKAG